MRTLPLPAIAPADLLTACIDGVSDAVKAARLRAASAEVLNAAHGFDQNARARTLHMVARVQGVGAANRDDLQGLYKDQMSSQRGSARGYYDSIRNAAPHGKCPLCGVGMVRTLDHHLPKSHYADLSVCPANLIPACDFCQAGKLAKYPNTAGEQTLHPYYDDYGAQQWIFAALDTAGPPALVFRVDAPAVWQPADRERVQRHFDVFKLGHVYTANANDDLSVLRSRLEGLAAAGGPAAVFAYLDEERRRHEGRLNSWQHITYQTLAAHGGFVHGGWAGIPI